MTRGQTVTTVLVTLIAAIALVAVTYINKDVAIKNAETAAEINAQTEIERTKIQEAESTARTKEWMNFVPWYEGGENKEVTKQVTSVTLSYRKETCGQNRVNSENPKRCFTTQTVSASKADTHVWEP